MCVPGRLSVGPSCRQRSLHTIVRCTFFGPVFVHNAGRSLNNLLPARRAAAESVAHAMRGKSNVTSLRLRRWITGREQPLQPAGSAIGPIRIRISFGFWITAFIPGLGGGAGRHLLWGAIFVASIVAHELAHAAVGLGYGRRATIVLHPLGGLTLFEPPLPRRRALLTLLAGPVVSLAIGLLLAFLRRGAASSTLAFAIWLNLLWGIINLFPILPFDGGRAMVECFGNKRRNTAVIISAVLAVAAAQLALMIFRSTGIAFFFSGAAVLSLFEWAKLKDQEVAAQASDQLTTARLLLLRERYFEARTIAHDVLLRARDRRCRNAALTTLAWSWLGEGEPRRARECLARIRPASAVDGYAVAAIEHRDGHPERAIIALDRQRQETGLTREAARLLVDLHAQRGDFSRAAEVARDLSTVLGADDLRRIVLALEQAGEHAKAAALAETIQENNPLQSERVTPHSPPGE
jgi:Zn-dependent protease